jgi:hypothetical protein
MLHHVGIAITLLIAVVRLCLVNGISISALLIFLVAPTLAYLVATRGRQPLAWIAESFLLLIAMGVILASFELLPPVFNEFPKLPRADNRLLSFHLWVYTLYVAGIIPPYAFGRSLWHHRRGERAELAPFICCLGLATWAVCMAIAVGAFIHLLNGGFMR